MPRIGRSEILCGGACLLSRDYSKGVLVSFIILFSSSAFALLFYVFPGAHMAPWPAYGLVVSTVAIGLCLISLCAEWITILSDPGIIPPRPEGDPPEEEDTTKRFFRGRELGPWDRVLWVGDVEVLCVYCDTCRIVRPARASHCASCDYCVEEFDHHCGIIGACIGRRTLRSFCVFVWSTWSLVCWVLSWCVCDIYWGHANMWDEGELPKSIVKIFLLTVTFCCVWSLTGLSGHYVYLIWNGITQRESVKMKFYYGEIINPYDKGCPGNCVHHLCSELPPSQVLLSN